MSETSVKFMRVPEGTEEFWKDHVNTEGLLSLCCAEQKAWSHNDMKTTYVTGGIMIDEVLAKAFGIEAGKWTLKDFQEMLEGRVVETKVFKTRSYTFCPGTNSHQHKYAPWTRVGNSWQGPVMASNCRECGYHFCNH